MRYALIQSGRVVNVIEAEADVIDQLEGFDAALASDAAGPGWHWDGQQLSAPDTGPVQAEPLPPRITRRAFRDRFTMAEKAAIEFAALDDAAAPMAQRQQAAMLRALLADQAAARFIDLEDASTRQGVQLLEQATLLAPGRADAILGAPVLPEELA
ncbi:MAG: hypothetical protein JSR74_12450 [Proteobacteria bacterium]|nr:hypothetical protein [Pseudomonadota bacterium]